MIRLLKLRYRHAIEVILAIGLLAGCNTTIPQGGGSASNDVGSSSAGGNAQDPGSASPDDAGESLSLASSTTRNLQVGDSWTYDERQETTVDGETTTTEGTHLHEVRADVITDLAGNSARVMAATFDVATGGENLISKQALWYFSQDAQGTFYQHGRLNAYVNPPLQRFVASPPGGRYAILISPITVGDTTSWDVVFDSGNRLAGQSTVVAIESVEVPAGSFVAARVEVTDTETNSTGTRVWEYTLWHVPELGRDVKAEFDLIVRDDLGSTTATEHRVRELIETNLVATDADLDGSDAGDEDSEPGDDAEDGEEGEPTGDGDDTTDPGDEPDAPSPDDDPEEGTEDEGGGDDEAVDPTDGTEDEIVFEPLPEDAELTSTASGLEYFHFQEGDGQQPQISSTVTVDYVGFLEDGTVFDQGEAVQFDLTSVIDGFAEGITLMEVGGASRFVIPPELGYGSSGNAAAGIGGDDTIVFDVTLISVDVL